MDFTKLSPYDFEYLVEDILKRKGFTVISRPAIGPDQGKDMIVERLVTDDMRITTHERYLVQCKHFITKRNSSVKESDIPNFTTRSKQHNANRFLLVTSGMVSETVKDLFHAENSDERSGIKCVFFSKHDLIDYLAPFNDLYEKYFDLTRSSLNAKAKTLLQYIYTHQFQVHRGAILFDNQITAVFGNDGYSSKDKKKYINLFRGFLKSENIKELIFLTLDKSPSWIMLVDHNDAKMLHDKIWEFHPGNSQWKLHEMNEAYDRLWTHWGKPFYTVNSEY